MCLFSCFVANIETYEVEDFLAHILDAEFNTVADDGSLIEVSFISRHLCKIERFPEC